jgi:hypothetical protein
MIQFNSHCNQFFLDITIAKKKIRIKNEAHWMKLKELNQQENTLTQPNSLCVLARRLDQDKTVGILIHNPQSRHHFPQITLIFMPRVRSRSLFVHAGNPHIIHSTNRTEQNFQQG